MNMVEMMMVIPLIALVWMMCAAGIVAITLTVKDFLEERRSRKNAKL